MFLRVFRKLNFSSPIPIHCPDHLHQRMSRNAKESLGMPRITNAKERQGMTKNAKECQGISRYTKECQGMPRNNKKGHETTRKTQEP